MYLVKEIEVSELSALLDDTQKKLEIYDVRSTPEVGNGTIPQAQHMPLHIIPSKVMDLSDNYPIILFCHLGARSAQACHYLQNAGFDNVFSLRGGYKAWVASGLAEASGF